MIEIYTKTDCPYCVLAKSWLKENNYDYTEHNLDDNEQRQKFYKDFNITSRTVPQIYLNRKLLGGYSELVKSELAMKFNPDKEDF